MKKWLVVAVLTLAVVAVAQQPAQPQPGQQPAGQPGAAQQPAQQKKEIKDPAEYNAYVSALQQQDPNQKVTMLESFVQQFPNSVVKEDALEQLMAAYQQTGNLPKTQEAAQRVLQVNPNNLRALAMLAYFARALAESGQNPQQNAAQAMEFGQRGLQALQVAVKPAEVSDPDWAKLKQQTEGIFHGALGRGALQSKNYPLAQQHFQAAVNMAPPTAESLRDVYPLAVSYLESDPMNALGLWYIARAAVLSNNNADILKYGRSKYIKYHGAEEGWQEVLAQARAANTNAAPQGFTVKPAPSPAEQARMLADQKDPKKMDFAEWELIFTYGEPALTERVWAQIKGIEVPFAAKVIESSRTRLAVAATAEAIEKNVANVVVNMAAPIPVRLVPRPGSEAKIVAKPDSYTPNPFVMTMSEGQLIAKAGATAASDGKAAPKRRTTRR